MAINTKHPLYVEFFQDWKTMRDTYRGERVIKDNGEVYLPATSGMHRDGMSVNQNGWKRYQAYKTRAVFHDFVSMAIEAMVGMMHTNPPVITLPKALEPLLENATTSKEGLPHLLRKINEEQLITGRLGLLLDLSVIANSFNTLPYIALYKAESIINWDDLENKTNLVVLNESEYERTSAFDWEFINKYRVLILENNTYYSGLYKENNVDFNIASMVAPSIRGATLDQIPFIFVNTKDLLTTPDDPPLLGLSQLSLAIYRGEADYRQNLFMQSQDTLVVIGAAEDEFRIGSGATIVLPQGGDAKFIGVTAVGLPEQRQSLENDKVSALNKSAQLINNTESNNESGAALTIRVAAQTATLNQIALTGAAALQEILRKAAEWVGADPLEVVVTPNLDFSKDSIDGKVFVDIMTAKTMGAPLSRKSIHKLLQDKNLTSFDYEEELEEISEEVVYSAEIPSLESDQQENDVED